MYPQPILAAFLALAATLVTAAPTPTDSAPLAKRTTHYGEGTIYYQDNTAGSCGNVNSDYALITALGNYWMNNEYESPFCGRTIQVTNTGSNDGVGGNGNTVVVTVADTCESCDENHLDFSLGAWNQLTNGASPGTIDIAWHFCNVDGQC